MDVAVYAVAAELYEMPHDAAVHEGAERCALEVESTDGVVEGDVDFAEQFEFLVVRAHGLDVLVEGVLAEMVQCCLDHATAVATEESLDGAVVLLACERDQVVVVHVAVDVCGNVVLFFHGVTPCLLVAPEPPCAFAPL